MEEAEIIVLVFCSDAWPHALYGGRQARTDAFAENIVFNAATLHLAVLLSFGCMLGAAATFAEPAIGDRQAAGASISAERAGLLKALLGPYVNWLVLAVVRCRVGSCPFGLLRLRYAWRLKVLLVIDQSWHA